MKEDFNAFIDLALEFGTFIFSTLSSILAANR